MTKGIRGISCHHTNAFFARHIIIRFIVRRIAVSATRFYAADEECTVLKWSVALADTEYAFLLIPSPTLLYFGVARFYIL